MSLTERLRELCNGRRVMEKYFRKGLIFESTASREEGILVGRGHIYQISPEPSNYTKVMAWSKQGIRAYKASSVLKHIKNYIS